MSFLREINFITLIALAVFGLGFVLLIIRGVWVSRAYQVSFITLVAKGLIRLSILACMLIALAGPHIPDKTQKTKLTAESRDFMIALDLSHSMISNDLKPNRLQRAKLFLNKLNRQHPADNFGIMIFSSNAYLQCPLTYDKEYFSKMLQFCSPRLVPSKGTDLYPVLKSCLDRLTHRDQIGNKSKIILLVSDGEDFGDELEEVAKEIKKEGIKVYCIGVGTDKGGTIKIGNDYKRDREGNIVRTSLNRKSLQKLAQITDGQYFEISDTRFDYDPLVRELKKVKGEKNTTKEGKSPNVTFYHYFLIVALILLLLDFFIKPNVVKL